MNSGDEKPKPKTFRDYLAEAKADGFIKTRESCPFADDPDFLALTPIQQKFIIGYGLRDLRGWSIANNYQFASPTDCSHHGATMLGHRMTRNEKVIPFLRKWDRMIVERFSQTADRILEEEQYLAYSDVIEYLDEDGLIRPEKLVSLPRSITAAIQSIEVVELDGGVLKYKLKLWDKSSSLARLERIKGMNAPEKTIVIGADVSIPEGTDPQEAARIYADILKGGSSE